MQSSMHWDTCPNQW